MRIQYFSLQVVESVGQRTWQLLPAWLRAGQPSLFDPKGIAAGQDHRSLNNVLQLTDISRPRIQLAQFQGVLVNFANLLAGFLRVALYAKGLPTIREFGCDDHKRVFSGNDHDFHLDSMSVCSTASSATFPFREPASALSNSIQPSLKPSSILMRGDAMGKPFDNNERAFEGPPHPRVGPPVEESPC